MKFGIILCRFCQRALGVQLRFKNTTCPYCGARIKLEPRFIKYSTESESELAEKISKINKQIDLNRKYRSTKVKDESLSGVDDLNEKSKLAFGTEFTDSLSEDEGKDRTVIVNGQIDKKQVHEELDPIKRIGFKFKNEKESITLMKTLVTNLYMELGEFSLTDLRRLFLECGIDDSKVEPYLEQLKNMNVIYEPKPGRFRIIED
jgi:hypothetical protein